jgi:hypothetical protein
MQKKAPVSRTGALGGERSDLEENDRENAPTGTVQTGEALLPLAGQEGNSMTMFATT